ncbi:MAG: hypothetical protein II903_09420 [Spirochaetales bacterium]|nr:hypothetical protein [Spirochaetales bacterium]
MSIDFSKKIPAADSWLKKAMALPKNTSGDSDVVYVGEGGQNSSIMICVDVNAAITLTATKVLTIDIKTSADGSSWKTLHSETFSEAPTGRVLEYVLPPSCKERVKATVTTDDSSADGKLDIYMDYIPR